MQRNEFVDPSPGAKERRIAELKEKIERIDGRKVVIRFAEECPLAIRERFLESVLAFEEDQAGRSRAGS